MNSRSLIIAVLILFGGYLLSFGPGLYLLIKTERIIGSYVPDQVEDLVGAAYRPHLYAMAYSETYYNYSYWWCEVADKRIPYTYPEFRDFMLPN
jgi:hypothetical protein